MTIQEKTHTAFVAMAQFYGVVVLICVTIWTATGAGSPFWPKWVILGVLIKLGIAARLVYGRTR